jgi:hypothetical protein
MHPSWIHPSNILLYPPSPILGTVSTGLIFTFSYTCTRYLHHIHPPASFPHILPLPIGTNPPRQDLSHALAVCFLLIFASSVYPLYFGVPQDSSRSLAISFQAFSPCSPLIWPYLPCRTATHDKFKFSLLSCSILRLLERKKSHSCEVWRQYKFMASPPQLGHQMSCPASLLCVNVPRQLFLEFLSFLPFFFLWDWDLNSRFCTWKAGALPLDSSPSCSGYFGDGGLMNDLPGLTLNLGPPELCLPSN